MVRKCKLSVTRVDAQNSLGGSPALAHIAQMESGDSLKVRVERRGDKYIWELHRDGLAHPVKFSGPVFSSEEAARKSGNEVRMTHLARLAAKWAKRTSAGRPRAIL
jgi:hypothetical protein